MLGNVPVAALGSKTFPKLWYRLVPIGNLRYGLAFAI